MPNQHRYLLFSPILFIAMVYALTLTTLVLAQQTKPPENDPPPSPVSQQEIDDFRKQWWRYREAAADLKQALLSYVPASQRQALIPPASTSFHGASAWADLDDGSIAHLLRMGYHTDRLETQTEILRNEAESLNLLRAQSQNTLQAKAPSAVFADPPELIEEGQFQVFPSVCEETSFALVWGFIHTNNVLETALATDRWFCKQEEFGENAALSCTIIEELVAISSNVTRSGGICLSAKGAARTEANLENLDRIDEFLRDTLNVTVSSRASETQLEDLKSSLEAVQQTLDNYLPVQFPLIQQRLDDLIAVLSENEQKLLDVKTRTADLAQRELLVDAESEDLDQRLADLQQSGSEIRTDTQLALNRLSDLQSQLAQHDNRQNGAFQQQTRDLMGEVLSQDVNGRLVVFQIPAQYGGQLEKVREYVVSALSQAQQNGVATAVAQGLLASGDGHYNSQEYHQAYISYVSVYRELAQQYGNSNP